MLQPSHGRAQLSMAVVPRPCSCCASITIIGPVASSSWRRCVYVHAPTGPFHNCSTMSGWPHCKLRQIRSRHRTAGATLPQQGDAASSCCSFPPHQSGVRLWGGGATSAPCRECVCVCTIRRCSVWELIMQYYAIAAEGWGWGHSQKAWYKQSGGVAKCELTSSSSAASQVIGIACAHRRHGAEQRAVRCSRRRRESGARLRPCPCCRHRHRRRRRRHWNVRGRVAVCGSIGLNH